MTTEQRKKEPLLHISQDCMQQCTSNRTLQFGSVLAGTVRARCEMRWIWMTFSTIIDATMKEAKRIEEERCDLQWQRARCYCKYITLLSSISMECLVHIEFTFRIRAARVSFFYARSPCYLFSVRKCVEWEQHVFANNLYHSICESTAPRQRRSFSPSDNIHRQLNSARRAVSEE